MRNIKSVFTLTIALYGCAIAQVSQVSGRINGVVTDPSGSPVANALVTSTDVDTGFERKAQSDGRGEYEVPLLPLGTYRMTVQARGFATFEQTGIKVRLDTASQVNVALQIGSTEQTVNVSADASILNPQTFSVDGTMNSRSITNMPLTSRNTFNLALFGPGYNGTADNEFGNPTFAFGGMQRRAFIMDGSTIRNAAVLDG